MIPIAKPLLGYEEAEAAQRVLASGQLAAGREVDAFEAEFAAHLGIKHVVAVTNGSTALVIALQALPRIDGKDEVIVPYFTFNATCVAPLAAGYRTVYADIDFETLTISPVAIERAITARTRAIIPVHLYGLMADMEPIRKLALERGIAVIEDAAQAHASLYNGEAPGADSTAAIFSFYATKNMTTGGEGGAIATNDDEYATTLRMLRQHGSLQRYHHEIVGGNYCMTELQAAIGREQLKKLAGFQTIRARNAAYYRKTLAGLVQMQFVPREHVHSWHQFVILTRERDKLAKFLGAHGIATSIHYPLADDRQPYINSQRSRNNADYAADYVLSIPVGPWVTPEDAQYIVEQITEAV